MSAIISIKNLSKTYPSGLQALNNVNLDIRRGEIFALLGPNGAGKTTLISIICGIVTPSEGSVTVDGHDILSDYRAARSKIGLVPQELAAATFESVWTTMQFSRGLFGKSPDSAYLEKVLRDLSLWDKLDARIMRLSGGMKRRLMIARSLMHRPKLLILDEPTAGVDIEIRHSMWDFLKDQNANGTTIILTTHYLEEAESLCNNIAIIDNGITIEQTQMRSLLNQLHIETFILYLTHAIDTLPDCGNHSVRMIDNSTLEVDINREQNISDLFSRLKTCGIEVVSMKNKTNRLEQLFISMLHNKT